MTDGLYDDAGKLWTEGARIESEAELRTHLSADRRVLVHQDHESFWWPSVQEWNGWWPNHRQHSAVEDDAGHELFEGPDEVGQTWFLYLYEHGPDRMIYVSGGC